jgi:hypothetical protein
MNQTCAWQGQLSQTHHIDQTCLTNSEGQLSYTHHMNLTCAWPFRKGNWVPPVAWTKHVPIHFGRTIGHSRHINQTCLTDSEGQLSHTHHMNQHAPIHFGRTIESHSSHKPNVPDQFGRTIESQSSHEPNMCLTNSKGQQSPTRRMNQICSWPMR